MAVHTDSWGTSHEASADVVARWDAIVLGLLAHRADVGEKVAELLALDPTFVPAILLEAFGMLFKGRNELHGAVRERLQRAGDALQQRHSTRNGALLSVVAAWEQDRWSDASRRLHDLRQASPADPFLAKLQHGLLFMMGRTKEMLEVLESTKEDWSRPAAGRGFIRGCYAFALEENGAIAAGEREGRAAVEEEPDDAWGIHAVAHAFGMSDRVDECISWLDQNAAGYSSCGVFQRHVYWHWALLHIERGELDAALHLFDTRVSSDWVGDYRDMSNQTTLLWRLEREGRDVGDRWDRLVEIAARHYTDHGSAFADVHYAMALARGGRESELVDSLHAWLDTADGDHADVQRRVGAPLCAVVAAAMTNEADVDAFEALAPMIGEIGGSLAQREIFDLMRTECAIDACRNELARSRLHDRLARRPNNAWAKSRLDQMRSS